MSFRGAVRALATVAAVFMAGCELQEVQVAEPEDVVVAEITLRAGATSQLAFLHRTRGVTGLPETVDSATIEVRNATGNVLRFLPAPDTTCVTPRNDTATGTRGSCYASPLNAMQILPGATYTLSIRLTDGRTMTGSTSVPADFRMIRPNTLLCSVPEFTPIELRWTRSENAWVYANETNLRNIRAALMPHNVTVDKDPLRLFGLAISNTDTTIVFPGEFGVFDRGDEDLTEALALMQRGLPRGVIADVVIAAADRNYVNWERGGNFNPSGPVRVPSIRGDGTGVFGSIVPKTFQIRVAVTGQPPC